MRILRKVLTIIVVIVLVLIVVVAAGGFIFVRRSFPQENGTIQVQALKSPVEVYRDGWGIPHIYAETADDLFFAQGYVHAQDRLWQMEFSRRVGSGTLSEILGPATLKTDRFLRTIGLRRAAERDWAVISDETKRVLEAYAWGVNAFIDSHQGNLPLEFTILGFKPAPWEPLDTLAWGKVMAWDLGGNWEAELSRARLIAKLGEERTRQLMPPYPTDGPFIIPPEAKSYAGVGGDLLAEYADIASFLDLGGEGVGSNNWVVDGSKTATGKPLLANDPHLGIQMPSIWYEVGLHGGGFDVVGVSFPGVPGVIIGHNQRIAWGVTNVGPDVQDLFIEKINPDNPHQYEFEGRWVDMEVVREEIKVKGQEPVTVDVRITRHGPIINDVVSDLDQPLAFRWTALDGGALFGSVFDIDQADNWEEFRTALRKWAAPSQNFVYADVDGNIGYQMPGQIPIRAKGQGLVPVPGWTGEYEWTGYIPFDELPSVYNPPTHFVATANNKVVPDDYPYFISYEWSAPYRAERIVSQLQASDNLTIDDFRDIQADTTSIPGQRLASYILHFQPQDELQSRAWQLVGDWDYRLAADSAAAAIVEVFHVKLLENTLADELGPDLYRDYLDYVSFHNVALEQIMADADSAWFDDVNTAEKEDREAIVQRSFAQAVEFLRDRLGDDPTRWRWDALHTAVFDHPLGAVKPLDRIFNRGPVPLASDGFSPQATHFDYNDPFGATTIASYRQIIDLSDFRRSVSMHTTGQSGQPFHRHYDDMIESWRTVRHHAMLWDRADVEKNKEGLLILTP